MPYYIKKKLSVFEKIASKYKICQFWPFKPLEITFKIIQQKKKKSYQTVFWAIKLLS